MTTANMVRLQTEVLEEGTFRKPDGALDSPELVRTTFASVEGPLDARWVVVRGTTSSVVTLRYAPAEEARKRENRLFNRGPERVSTRAK